MPNFVASAFAVAGLVAALGPLAIHLLNRRRPRVVEWAAMELLREALSRHRRALELRDVLLLALRMLCVAGLGVAMARPYFTRSKVDADPSRALHAVIILDNSLSMAYRRDDGSLANAAKRRAARLASGLPQGSWVTVIPLAGAGGGAGPEPRLAGEEAAAAIDAVRTVDRAGSIAHALDAALAVVRRTPELPAPRVVLFTDGQRGNWPREPLTAELEELGGIHVVEVDGEDLDPGGAGVGDRSAPAAENTWVAEVRLRDGIADSQTPAEVLVTVRHQGTLPRRAVQVTLSVGGTAVSSQTVDLEPDQSREVVFVHRFAAVPGAAGVVFARVVASISPDRLEEDDERAVAVPVVASLPVVFVDEVGEAENPSRGLFGETLPLRRLLAPLASRSDRLRQLVEVRHTTIAGLSEETLGDARLVVLAGIESPEPAVDLLRAFVEEGGQLVVAAGGAFDPARWTASAWRDGAGILAAPLSPHAVGRLPDEAGGVLEPFFFDFATLVSDWFRVEGEADAALAALYSRPLFFKAVEALLGDARVLATDSGAKAEPVRGPDASAPPAGGGWLLWAQSSLGGKASDPPAGESALPRCLASYTNGLSFLVERAVGKGRVLLITTGLKPEWSTLARTDAVLCLDRALRGLLAATLPPRNFGTSGAATIPVDAAQRASVFTLTRPDGRSEPALVEALGESAFGLVLRRLDDRGHYRVVARADAREGGGVVWESTAAANGPEAESRLERLPAAELAARADASLIYRVPPGTEPLLEGGGAFGLDLWWWILLAVLGVLAAEMLILGGPLGGRRQSR